MRLGKNIPLFEIVIDGQSLQQQHPRFVFLGFPAIGEHAGRTKTEESAFGLKNRRLGCAHQRGRTRCTLLRQCLGEHHAFAKCSERVGAVAHCAQDVSKAHVDGSNFTTRTEVTTFEGELFS